MGWLCHGHGMQGSRGGCTGANTTCPAHFLGLFPVLWTCPGAGEGALGSKAVPTGSGLRWSSPGLLFLWDSGAVHDLEAVAGACSVPDFQMTLGWELQTAAAPRFPGATRMALSPHTGTFL